MFPFPTGTEIKSKGSCLTQHRFLADNITLIGSFKFWNDIFIFFFIWASEMLYFFNIVRTYSEIWRHRALPLPRRR